MITCISLLSVDDGKLQYIHVYVYRVNVKLKTVTRCVLAAAVVRMRCMSTDSEFDGAGWVEAHSGAVSASQSSTSEAGVLLTVLTRHFVQKRVIVAHELNTDTEHVSNAQ